MAPATVSNVIGPAAPVSRWMNRPKHRAPLPHISARLPSLL